MTHLLMFLYDSYPLATVVVLIAWIVIYRLRAENKDQAERDAYTDRVYREKSFDEKFDQIRRNRSERPEDWL